MPSRPTAPSIISNVKKDCKFCQKSFTPKRPWEKFCRQKCKDDYNNWRKTIKRINEIIVNGTDET